MLVAERTHGWHRARALAGQVPAPLAAVRVPVSASVGLVLARPVTAVVASPAFDAAAMDGFAVAGPGPWTVIGRILAGRSRRQGRWGGPGRARRPDHRDRLVISSSTMPRAAFNGSVGSRI